MYAYKATMIMADVIERVGTTNKASVRELLQRPTTQTSWGTLSLMTITNVTLTCTSIGWMMEKKN